MAARLSCMRPNVSASTSHATVTGTVASEMAPSSIPAPRNAVNSQPNNASLPRNKRSRLHFVDMYGAFQANRPTRAFPQPKWFTGTAFDMVTIGHLGDTGHPRRLASIYAGEIAGDALDLVEMRGFARK